MNPDRTRQILQFLADGNDPYTGETFPPDSPYQRADTVRALYAALQALNSAGDTAGRPDDSTAPKKPADPNKPRAGGAWTPEEEQKLRDAFAAQQPIPEIARAHGRSRGAITTRLVKLGLISINDQPRNERPQPPIPLLPNHRFLNPANCPTAH